MDLVPDYADLFGNEMLSDLIVVLEEENASTPQNRSTVATRKSKRQKVSDVAAGNQADQQHRKVLPGHSVVLYGCSSFARTKLEHWRSSNSSGELEIQLPVPTGQLDVGELLVKGMYAAQLDLTSCSQERLVQLLLLADRYGVSKLLAAVTAAFQNLPTAELAMQTIRAVYNLPAGCADLDCCKDLFTAASKKLQLELGDLELVFASAHKLELLRALPHRALLQLLQDPATRVASENTVFHTIECWWQGRPDNVTDADLCQLVQLVRIKNCSPLYLATILAHSELVSRCFKPGEIAEACSYSALALRSSGNQQLAHALQEASAVLARYPAWTADKRPPSAVMQLDVQWVLPMQQLQEAVKAHLRNTAKNQYVKGPERHWQGRKLLVMVIIHTISNSAWLGLYVGVDLPPAGVAEMTFEAAIKAAGSRGAPATNLCPAYIGGARYVCKYNQLSRAVGVSLDPLSSWSDAEQQLRQLGLVHADGCLHIQVQVLALA